VFGLLLCLGCNDLSEHLLFLLLFFYDLKIGIFVAGLLIINLFVIFLIDLVVVLVLATSTASPLADSHLLVNVHLSHKVAVFSVKRLLPVDL
jgi:hypothetical protein